MKQRKTVTLATALIMAAAAFSASASAKDRDDENQGGLGQLRDLPVFTAVSMKGSMDITVTSGENQRVEIIAEPEMLEYIRTRVTGGELRIWVKRKNRLFNRLGNIELRISMADLRRVEINGSGDARASQIDTDKFALEINGSGDADLQGKCGSVLYEINGSGDVDGTALKCVDAKVEINGSGDVDLWASGKLNAEINGSGDILASGGPRIGRFSSHGSGSISTRD